MQIIKSTISAFENRFIVDEIGSEKIKVLKQYQTQDLSDVVFNFNFGSFKKFSSQHIFEELQSMEKNIAIIQLYFLEAMTCLELLPD